MRLVLLAISLVLGGLPARAGDDGLQRALIEASCPTGRVTRLAPIGRSEIYEAECFGRRIKIVCANGGCRADAPCRQPRDPD